MKPIDGYVYAPDADPGLLAGAAPGAIVRKSDRSPPWIVVDHAIESAVIARWPGRLYRVVVLDAEGIEQASAHAKYTRAVAVQVCDEVPASRLFGDHGEAVATVISFAARLELPTARLLAELRHPLGDQAYSRAWCRWLNRTGVGTANEESDYSMTLAAGPGPSRSPINYGLTLTYQAVWDRADAVLGSGAFVDDEEGERTLAPVWSSAAAALLDAAMALGAPSMVTEEDAVILTAAWRSVADPARF
jgi:hypothetical protein